MLHRCQQRLRQYLEGHSKWHASVATLFGGVHRCLGLDVAKKERPGIPRIGGPGRKLLTESVRVASRWNALETLPTDFQRTSPGASTHLQQAIHQLLHTGDGLDDVDAGVHGNDAFVHLVQQHAGPEAAEFAELDAR